MEQKYKAGDVVHVRLDELKADSLNRGDFNVYWSENIIAHISAPEPVVRWVVYSYRSGHTSELLHNPPRKEDFGDNQPAIRLEWRDGDTSKKPVVMVEDV